MVAGLTSSDEGRIQLVGRDVTDLPPQQRGVGLVFQNYSVFQHMTAAENVAFGLRIRGVRRKERRRKSEELMDLVGLGGLGNRYARQLSGGQTGNPLQIHGSRAKPLCRACSCRSIAGKWGSSRFELAHREG